jgi:hypothetical protein
MRLLDFCFSGEAGGWNLEAGWSDRRFGEIVGIAAGSAIASLLVACRLLFAVTHVR